MDDDDREFAREARHRKNLERLGFDDPRCLFCGEDDVRCLELDHVAGRSHSDDVWPLCRNCHATRTDLQKDHPPKVAPPKDSLEVIGRFLLGLADFFEMLIGRLREYGETLIAMATNPARPSCGSDDHAHQ
jgi:hypothetical protein